MEHKIENTLRRYTSSMLPLLARSFFVNVMVDIDGHYYGTINQVFYEKEVLFYGLDDAVLKIDHMLDELRCPRASTELRKFENKSKPDLNTWTVEERIEAEKKKMPLLYEVEKVNDEFWVYTNMNLTLEEK